MNSKDNSILLVEDDNSFGYILSEYLLLNGYRVLWIKDGKRAIDELQENKYDLCILDISLPGADGFQVAQSMKFAGKNIPFIFLTARALKIDKLKGYRLGCDDYEVKPVDEELLLAKIKAIINRSNRPEGTVDALHIGKYVFQPANQKLIYDNEERILTEKENELLKQLVLNANNLVERKHLLKTIWGVADLFSRKSMDVFITRLRKYLEKDVTIRIRNIHNRGFILETNNSEEYSIGS